MAKSLQLNSAAPSKQANVKSVCNSLRKKLQEKHPDWEVATDLKTINNGFQITCPGWTFDIVRYQKWLRLDILKAGEKQAKFFKTDAPEVRDVVIIFMSRIEDEVNKAAKEQPTQTEEPKTVTPLKWVSETGMNGTSGWYAYLERPDGSQETLAHVSTCGMIYWESDKITPLDKDKINKKASRIYHEWLSGYENASDTEKENTYIAPNLSTTDSFAMTRDRKKVELREKQPDKYKKYPTRAQWLDEWKNEMFDLLKQDGYKYPSDVSTNSNRKGKRPVKTLRLDSNKMPVDEELGDIPSPFYPDAELLMPVNTKEVLEALKEVTERDGDTGMLVVHFHEELTDKDLPYLAYVQPVGYDDNNKIMNDDTSAKVDVKFIDGDYNESLETRLTIDEVASYLDSVKNSPVTANSSRKSYLRRKMNALNCSEKVDHRNDLIWEVKGDGFKAVMYNEFDANTGKQSTKFQGQVKTKKNGKTYFTCDAKDSTELVAALEKEYGVEGLTARKVGNGPKGTEDIDWREYTDLNSAKLPVGGTSKSEVDNEFMNDVDSILSLSTGDTIDVDTVYLAYNPDTKEMILSDESENTLDSGYIVIGKFTPDKDALAEIAGKEPELEPDEEDEDFGEENADIPEDDTEESSERDSHVPAPEDEENEGGIF